VEPNDNQHNVAPAGTLGRLLAYCEGYSSTPYTLLWRATDEMICKQAETKRSGELGTAFSHRDVPVPVLDATPPVDVLLLRMVPPVLLLLDDNDATVLLFDRPVDEEAEEE
jgi:hypothetical protein